MHSVKFGYLVFAVTVHLLLILFECHGNKEYACALACVCVRTYLYVWSELQARHPFKDSGRPHSPRNPRPLAHHIDTQPIPKIFALNCNDSMIIPRGRIWFETSIFHDPKKVNWNLKLNFILRVPYNQTFDFVTGQFVKILSPACLWRFCPWPVREKCR